MSYTSSSMAPTLLSIPKELRLMIYDELFRPLVQRPANFDSFVLPCDWPTNDLSAMTSITLVSKTIRAEAKAHFDLHFLPSLLLYFDTVPGLARFCSAVKEAPMVYQHVQCCLHSGLEVRPTQSRLSERDKHEWRLVVKEANRDIAFFIACQPATPNYYYDLPLWLDSIRSKCAATTAQDNDESWPLPWQEIHTAIQHMPVCNGSYEVLNVPMPDSSTAVSIRQLCAVPATKYMQLVGKAQDFVFEGSWDPESSRSVSGGAKEHDDALRSFREKHGLRFTVDAWREELERHVVE